MFKHLFEETISDDSFVLRYGRFSFKGFSNLSYFQSFGFRITLNLVKNIWDVILPSDGKYYTIVEI